MDPFRRGSTSGDSSDSESSLEDVTRVQDENEYSLHDSDDVNDEKAVFLGNDEESLSLSAPAPKHSRRLLLLPLGLIVIVLISTWGATRQYQGRHRFNGKGLKPISIEHLANGTFRSDRIDISWSSLGEGMYTERTRENDIILVDLQKGQKRTLVHADQVTNERGEMLQWNTFEASSDGKRILFGADRRKQWRHSSMSNFHLHNLVTNTTSPLRTPSATPHTAMAHFSPTNHSLAWVHANDLYVQFETTTPEGEKEDRSLRLTNDGSPTTFNGVPDWVYEEEVFSSDVALWWSPFSAHLAYMRFDEEKVPEYEFPIYNDSPSQPGASPYPGSVVMRYPKPGYPNPLVSLHIFSLDNYRNLSSIPARPVLGDQIDAQTREAMFDLEFDKPFPADDVVISEVVWVSEQELLVRATNRASNIERVTLFTVPDRPSAKLRGQTLRETTLTKEQGWIEAGPKIVPLNLTLPSNIPGYLNVMPDETGFNHIALFSPPNATEPIFITKGDWEVDGLPFVNYDRGNVYFRAANPSTERHYFAVPLPLHYTLAHLQRGEMQKIWPLTNTSEPGMYSMSFSSRGGYFVLDYLGPDLPRQELRHTNIIGSDLVEVLASNSRLEETAKEFRKVDQIWSTVSVDGVDLNVQEMRPADMDTSGRTKYPILFSVYGGPSSQKVNHARTYDLHQHLVTTYKYVVVNVDPRGTGFKGRKFRMGVREQLGAVEAADVVATARYYAEQRWADPAKIGVWGWSYGGYLTNKVVETNSSVFTLAMSVAPVTSWLYYDSIYTERYMSTPALNKEGYEKSSVRDMEGFKHVDYALAHGSGDDNVHFLNTAALLDELTVAQVRDFRFRLFTDSDHSMGTRGAYWELMHWLTDFLVEKWGVAGQSDHKHDTRE